MDLQMPEMDGFSAAHLLRASGYRGPMIALTANALSEERERCLVAGFDAFISKTNDASKRSEALHTCQADCEGNQEAGEGAAMAESAADGARFFARSAEQR